MNSYRINVKDMGRQSHYWQVVAVLMTIVAIVLAFVAWHTCSVQPCAWAGYDSDPTNSIADGNYVCTYDLGQIH